MYSLVNKCAGGQLGSNWPGQPLVITPAKKAGEDDGKKQDKETETWLDTLTCLCRVLSKLGSGCVQSPLQHLNGTREALVLHLQARQLNLQGGWVG